MCFCHPLGCQMCFSPSEWLWLGLRPAFGARDVERAGQHGAVLLGPGAVGPCRVGPQRIGPYGAGCGALGYGATRCRVWGHALWGHTGQGAGLRSVRRCSAGCVGRTGSLCSRWGTGAMLAPHCRVLDARTCPSQGGGHTGAVRVPGHKTPMQCPPVPLRSSAPDPWAVPSRNQPTESICCTLLVLETLRITRFLFFKPHRGESCTQRVNCNETPFGFSTHTPPPQSWQPCSWVFIAR